MVTAGDRLTIRRGDLAGLVVMPDGTAVIATADGELVTEAAEVARIDAELRPRWATWSQDTARLLVDRGVRLSTCWDIAAVHRLRFGGFRADPGYAWALLRGLDPDGVPPPARRPGGTDRFNGADLFDAARDAALASAAPGAAAGAAAGAAPGAAGSGVRGGVSGSGARSGVGGWDAGSGVGGSDAGSGAGGSDAEIGSVGWDAGSGVGGVAGGPGAGNGAGAERGACDGGGRAEGAGASRDHGRNVSDGRGEAGSETGSETEEPVGPDGYLKADWARGGWANSPGTAAAWARLALQAAELQLAVVSTPTTGQPDSGSRSGSRHPGTGQARSGHPGSGGNPVGIARSESTAELLCAELAADGLPMNRAAMEDLLTELIGPRPGSAADAAASRAARDERVLRLAPAGVTADLRSTVQVRAMLAAAGINVPDTRKWRLTEFARDSPLVAALLEWRKAERIATTYGYAWLDEHLGPDGRLRGTWTGCDGAAGRMTASSGLHNMPAVLRAAVLAEPGCLFVRADLGQIEPRVLAAVSGDAALAAATAADDMYLPVAAQLGVDRPTAKVAMIAAMYGQTTGHGGAAGRRMRSAYPVAMGYLETAGRSASAGHDLRTYGGRLIRVPRGGGGRGLYGRNALIQGAAAELFKMWAVTVRARAAALDARIVLCLHDELLLHVPAEQAPRVCDLVADCLAETASRWAPGGRVRFLADVSAVGCWADAKG